MSTAPEARFASAAYATRLASLLGASAVVVARATRLAGGAIQQNLRIDATVDGGRWSGERSFVLRMDSASAVDASGTRQGEFALLCAAHAAAVITPLPVAFDPGDANWPPAMLTLFVEGATAGRALTRAAGDHAPLVEAIGENLARIHAIDARAPTLAFLGAKPASPSRELLDGYRASIAHWRDFTGNVRPVLAWTLRWLDARLPAHDEAVLVHRDYRIGNLMVEGGRLVATLDWEFAGWGNPLEDLGWFCAPCWRFARGDREAGGLASIDDLLRGYNRVAGTAYEAADTKLWQVMAEMRWAVVALQQALRCLEGGERTLELALTGRLLPELEAQMLMLGGDRFA